MLHLLPSALDALRDFASPPAGLFETPWSSAYPRVYDRAVPPPRWFADDVATYVERAHGFDGVEAKSGATAQADWLEPLVAARARIETRDASRRVRPVVVFGGDSAQKRTDATIVPWRAIAEQDGSDG